MRQLASGVVRNQLGGAPSHVGRVRFLRTVPKSRASPLGTSSRQTALDAEVVPTAHCFLGTCPWASELRILNIGTLATTDADAPNSRPLPSLSGMAHYNRRSARASKPTRRWRTSPLLASRLRSWTTPLDRPPAEKHKGRTRQRNRLCPQCLRRNWKTRRPGVFIRARLRIPQSSDSPQRERMPLKTRHPWRDPPKHTQS